MGKVTLLIDGDVEAFKAASVSQESIDWGDEDESMDLDKEGARDYLVSALSHYQKHLKAPEIIICLTHECNWRKELCPDYKANRKDAARPLLLQYCREFLASHYRVECWPRLEADDVMGILSQSIRNSIIVSVDKDMKTIPCRLFNPGRSNEGVVTITPTDAFINHMYQTLTGDSTDGFKGCPGIGPKKATKILREATPELDSPGSVWDQTIDFENGKVNVWNAVVNSFVSSELTAEDALMQARLAYILRSPGEYNRKTSKLKLWRPPA